MIAARNPGVADLSVAKMVQAEAGFHVAGITSLGTAGQGSMLLIGGAPTRPASGRPTSGIPGHGWQHEATKAVHAHLFSTSIWPRLFSSQQALIRSQGGSMSGVPFTCFPVRRYPELSGQFVRARQGNTRFLATLGEGQSAR